MSDSNSPADVLAQQSIDPAYVRELEAKIRQFEQSNVVRPVFNGEAPRYKLNEPGYYDDNLFPEGSEIEFIGTPNFSMVPLNEPARRAMEEFIEYQTECQRERDMTNGRQFAGLITDKGVMIANGMVEARRAAREMGPQARMPEDKSSVPPMPHTEEARAANLKRGRGRPKKVLASKPPPAPARPGAKQQDGYVGPGQEPAIFGDQRVA